MSRIVGSRELHQYEKHPENASGVYAAPLITKWSGLTPCGMMLLAPREVSGVVLDIGSGDDSLGLELYAADANVEMHRVNPALGPESPLEIQFAMGEAICARAAILGIPIDIINEWSLHHNIFPDITGLPQADLIVSLYCFPTIDFEESHSQKERRRKLNAGFDAIANLSKPDNTVVVGPFDRGDNVMVERVINKTPVLRRKRQQVIRGDWGQVILKLL